MSAENQETPQEEVEAPQEEVAPVKAKKPRTQAQLDALKRARERALVARKQYAKERKERKAQVAVSRPSSPEPEPEPEREPSPEPDPNFSDHAEDFSEVEEEEAPPAPAPQRPQVDRDTINEIIGAYKEEKKRLKEAQPKPKFRLDPSGYYIYDP